MKTIRSQNHQIGSYEINKVSLSCFDDKRYILEDGISSYAYGHHLINSLWESNIYKKVDVINIKYIYSNSFNYEDSKEL